MKVKNQQLNKVFGSNELFLREMMGVSQAHVGRTSGVSQRTISNIESMGEAGSPTLDTVELLSEYYDAPAWQLLLPGISQDKAKRDAANELFTIFSKSGCEAREQIIENARRLWKVEALKQELDELKRSKN